MKMRALSRSIPVLVAGCILASCDFGTHTDCDCGAAPEVGRFGVSDSLLGRWVGLAGTRGANDTFAISKDSLVGQWSVGPSGTVRQDLKPHSDVVFYGHGGRMGLTNGMTSQDNVSFEYMFTGETLWVELQGSKREDGLVVRSDTLLTHGWLRRR